MAGVTFLFSWYIGRIFYCPKQIEWVGFVSFWQTQYISISCMLSPALGEAKGRGGPLPATAMLSPSESLLFTEQILVEVLQSSREREIMNDKLKT